MINSFILIIICPLLCCCHRSTVLLFFVGAISASSKKWHDVEGALRSVSIGKTGVWGTNKYHNIYYRDGTYHEAKQRGNDWNQVPGECIIIPRSISVQFSSRWYQISRKGPCNAVYPSAIVGIKNIKKIPAAFRCNAFSCRPLYGGVQIKSSVCKVLS